MSDRDAFLAAIHDAPDDDAPRLVFADWLEENGQSERAELIRIQIKMHREREQNARVTLRLAKLFLRQKALFSLPWADSARRCGANLLGTHSRGFPDRMTMSAQEFAAAGLDVVEWIGPRTHIRLHECAGMMERVASQISLRYVRSLSISQLGEHPHTDADVAAFLRSPYLSGLMELHIAPWMSLQGEIPAPLTSEVARSIAAAPSITRLHTLSVSDIRIGVDGFAALTGATNLASLRVLVVGVYGLGEFAMGPLLAEHRLSGLESFVVTGEVTQAVYDRLTECFGKGVIRARVFDR
ncbi:MAG TPA: TIGR02996 domain-containing protein [Gemmataceae bacterium]|nr:TIGR02996 domain-containing protein [Gemmataceae bacterium]